MIQHYEALGIDTVPSDKVTYLKIPESLYVNFQEQSPSSGLTRKASMPF